MRKFKDYSKIISHSIYPIEYKAFCKEYREKKDRYDLVWFEITPRTVSYEWVYKQTSYMKEEYKAKPTAFIVSSKKEPQSPVKRLNGLGGCVNEM